MSTYRISRQVCHRAASGAVATLLASALAWAQPAATYDLRRAAPSKAHLAAVGMPNPERAYQRAYLEEAWATFQDERIFERMTKIVMSRMPPDKIDEAHSILAEIQSALAPMRCAALWDAKQSLVSQQMQGVSNLQLVAFKLPLSDAEGYEKGAVQLLELIAKKLPGKVEVVGENHGDAVVTTLEFPGEVPFQPSVGRLGDVVLFATHASLVENAVQNLQSPDAKSLFDDPRFQEAMRKLPSAEDAITLFDGRNLFESLAAIGDQIRTESPDKEKAEIAARMIDRVISEINIFDYEAAVEFTEGGQNRAETLGRLSNGSEDKLLFRVLASGQPIADWERWIPADATAYSLSSGLNLHALYDGVVTIVREELPNSESALEQWEQLQSRLNVHLDADILQSFSGESVSLSVPVEGTDGAQKNHSVTALRCTQPEKIRQLLHRAVESLQRIPAMRAQNLQLASHDELDGFERLECSFFAMLKVEPVIGFRDDWMMISSNSAALEKVLAVRAGEAPALDRQALEKRFGLKIDGPVSRLSYTDLGANIRAAADLIDQIGAMAPLLLGMAAANAAPEQIEPLQEALALLPSIAKVVRKFDFLEQRLGVVQAGDEPYAYRKHVVTLLRSPDKTASAASSE